MARITRDSGMLPPFEASLHSRFLVTTKTDYRAGEAVLIDPNHAKPTEWAEHQEEIEHPLEEMNSNQDGIEGPLIAEPETNHGKSVTPSNDAQIAPLQRLSFLMSILFKLAKVSDLLALLQPIRRLKDLHLNLHRLPLKAEHYLR
ncbi:hypothetical protein SLEP1_g59302 [Rubroshorea leprosula]|uniref:Uncharacterized protein n=1 Tax=Rubroshorea leprosula TaxID=152421 RepID=A0AAV5MT31_9ROSI|nr:hypothetical protein SLEP1_g59302 [Rubroshorea leprosula]